MIVKSIFLQKLQAQLDSNSFNIDQLNEKSDKRNLKVSQYIDFLAKTQYIDKTSRLVKQVAALSTQYHYKNKDFLRHDSLYDLRYFVQRTFRSEMYSNYDRLACQYRFKLLYGPGHIILNFERRKMRVHGHVLFLFI